MNVNEQTLCFLCHNSWLYGILSLPEQTATKGVLIVVGGPQYRAGSHRQFTLLARYLSTQGIPVMRFDFRGMGDSQGETRTFENIEDDLCCAINHYFNKVTSLKEVVIWGLCDAASAAILYAYQDKRITGLVLLNPWVRTDQGAARAYLKHYYISRIFDTELWGKIWAGNFSYIASIKSFFNNIYKVSKKRNKKSSAKNTTCLKSHESLSLPEKIYNSFSLFKGRTLIITSGDDLVAKEFLDLVETSKDWQDILKSPNIEHHNLPDANHTFSRCDWRNDVAAITETWLKSW